VDWAQTYNNSGHTGENIAENTLSPANVGTLGLKWARSLAGDVRTFLVNDHYVDVRAPSDDGQDLDLLYLNYRTGELVWKIDTGPDVPGANGTLATGDALIFSECGLVDGVGYKYSGICAYHKQHGQLAWQFSSPCNCSQEANVTTPLLYAHHKVFFGYFMGGSAGKEYAIVLDAASGHFDGAYETGGYNSLSSAPFAQERNQTYFGCSNSLCAAAHRNTSLRWSSNIGAPLGAVSADRNGRIYANLCNGSAGLVALDDVTGKVGWTYGAPECNQTPTAAAYNQVYFTAADGKVHVLNAKDGTELWSTASGAASSVSLANGVMYLTGGAGAPGTSAYNAMTGSLLWKLPPHASRYAPAPVIIDGTLFVANQKCGTICAYGLPSH
jgi:outer membrane protein assembly factor BamB